MNKTIREKEKILKIGFLIFLTILTGLNLIITVSGKREKQVHPPQRTISEEADDISPSGEQRIFPYDPYLDNDDGFWEIGGNGRAYEKAGVEAYLELCRLTGADAALVASGSRIIGEWYAPDYRPPLYAMSSTKSVTSLLAGIMVSDGLLALEDPVGKYLEPWSRGKRADVTVEHLLSNTGGFEKRTGEEESVGFVAEKNEFVTSLEPDYSPGSRWIYSNEGFQLLSPVFETVLGGNLKEFAEERLFNPLGMEHTEMMTSGKNGDVWTYADMKTTPRDFARLGLLVRGEGNWKGKRILEPAYIALAQTPGKLNGSYGLGWWLFSGEEHIDAAAARGYLNTDMYILNDSDIVIVRMQNSDRSYSGSKDSGCYPEFSREIINSITGKTPVQRLQGIMEELRNRAVLSNVEKDLENSITLSRNGNENEVLDIVLPIIDSPAADSRQKAMAACTAALQYIRKKDETRALVYLKIAEDNGAETLEGYWKDSFLSMKETLEE